MLPARMPSAPTVSFDNARRPEAATHVQLDEWEGPLGLLLSLIEARQLDVLTVPLGGLAGAYLEALARLDADRIGNVSSFVAVASQLILIKSRAMLPRHEVGAAVPLEADAPDPESELRARLLLYRAYRDAGEALAESGARTGGLYHREISAAQASAVAGARPPAAQPIPIASLVRALDDLMRIAPPPEPPPEVMPRTVTLAERAALIRRALADAPAVVLQELLGDVRDRVVVAVTFLAMLELVKRREIVVEQDRPWGPIVARRTSPGRGAAEGADGSDGETFDESLESFA